MAVVVMMVGRTGGERKEDGADALEGNAFAVEELKDGGILGCANGVRENFDAEMEIAQVPGEMRGLVAARDRNFQHGLGALMGDVAGVVVDEEGGAVGKRGGKIEAEFAAIVGDAAPAALGQGGAIGAEFYFARGGAVNVREMLDDDEAGHKFYEEAFVPPRSAKNAQTKAAATNGVTVSIWIVTSVICVKDADHFPPGSGPDG
jgi:hypothetical protein